MTQTPETPSADRLTLQNTQAVWSLEVNAARYEEMLSRNETAIALFAHCSSCNRARGRTIIWLRCRKANCRSKYSKPPFVERTFKQTVDISLRAFVINHIHSYYHFSLCISSLLPFGCIGYPSSGHFDFGVKVHNRTPMNCERSCLRCQCRLEYEKSFVNTTARLTTVKDNAVRFTSFCGHFASTP